MYGGSSATNVQVTVTSENLRDLESLHKLSEDISPLLYYTGSDLVRLTL